MEKRKFFYLLMLGALLCILLLGCTSSKPAVSEKDMVKIPIEDSDDGEVVISEPITNEINEGLPSPISGIYTKKENTFRRPIAVMLDNQSQARPQAGLEEAEIVYEMLAEGWITRYMAIFMMNEPAIIGPVRSARSYFIDMALEYDALYVHVGGSPQAFADIKNLSVADIDAMSRGSNTFWRKNHKKAPHNMYTSTEALREAAGNYKQQGEFTAPLFSLEDRKLGGNPALNVEIPYYKNYHPSFQYDIDKKVYYRNINGKPHVDEVSKNHLYTKNIIIQKCTTKVIDDEGRLDIKVVGSGTGYYITNGEMIEITWKKNSRKEKTKYYDLEGKEILLNPGITWIEVIPDSLAIIYE